MTDTSVAAFRDLLQKFGLANSGLRGHLGGVTPAARALAVAAIAIQQKKAILVLTASRLGAELLLDDLATLLPMPGALCSPEEKYDAPYARLFPEIGMSLFDEGESDSERLAVLSDLKDGQPIIVIAPLLAFLQPTASPDGLRRKLLQVGQSEDREKFYDALQRRGYQRVDEVRNPGQFCVHSDVIDLYSPNGGAKRLRFEGDTLSGIHSLSVKTQRSVDDLKACDVMAMAEPERDGSLIDSFPKDSSVILVEKAEIHARLDEMSEAAEEKWRFSSFEEAGILQDEDPDDWKALQSVLGTRSCTTITQASRKRSLALDPLPDFEGLDGLVKWAKTRDSKAPLVVVSLHSRRVSRLLSRRGLKNCSVMHGVFSQGFRSEFGDVITDWELFGSTRRLRYEFEAPSVDAGVEFTEGDLVVHAERGIGRFVGLVPVDLEGARRDLFRFEYAKDQTLMVPPEQMGQLTLYRGGEDQEPNLSRLDTGAWQKTLAKANISVEKTARVLDWRRKERAKCRAVPMGPDTPEQEDLEAAFPFDETPSQLKSIAEIKADMESEIAMDRLLCGDVGYGKTEVALRAAFKAVSQGFQAAVLVPTTVLAQQHFESFRLRMEPLGVEVAGLWGGVDEADNIVSCLADGSLKMVVGTHSLLSNEITFDCLGLLVVDEEQMFGVGHKERLSELSEGVHVLSMSATPIPRTMQMALAGVRDISLLDAPPRARRPIRTYLLKEDDKFLTAAAMRELERDGQVFVLHNKVADLPDLAERLGRLVPRGRVAVAHGQMESGQLERVLAEFEATIHDVLVCSTIIESGIDFPNVNSIIIRDAHMFGLAQLYQIRGRVGRSGRQAYCYLMIPPDADLSDKARQRLETIDHMTELGSGYQIALRDLEIRGAGDLLGGDQSGQIARVGYGLYSRLLEEALTGDSGESEAELCAIELPFNAHIPVEYIGPATTRIVLYRRLCDVQTHEEIDRLGEELSDRFGEPPNPVLTLLELTHLRLAANRKGITTIHLEESFGERTIVCDGRKESLLLKNPPKAETALMEFLLNGIRNAEE